MAEEIIRLEEISKTYHLGEVDIPVLRGVSFLLEKGEHCAIMGPSGSGKTTLLNILGCLDKPTSGRYLLDGHDISLCSDDELSILRSTKIGFIFQSYNLISQLTLLENVGVPLFYQRVDEHIVRERAWELVKLVGLEDRANHRPTELSGGQQQRVAIARSLINEPVVLFADEPTGNLDSSTGKDIMNLLCSLNEQGKTIILVTHDAKVAAYAGRTVHMLDGKMTHA